MTGLTELMELVQRSFVPEKANGMSGVFQAHVTGVENGDWTMTLQDGNCRISPGVAAHPRAMLIVSKEDLDGLISGQLDPVSAFFSGKIDLQGDVNSLIELISMFKLDRKG
jgi:alkyl sulfatase BDS1-like metallo-beta-lactamase superfamily hydrolase